MRIFKDSAALELSETGAGSPAREDIPSLVWLWAPLPVLLAAVGAGAVVRNYHPKYTSPWFEQVRWYEAWFHGENGVIEIGTFLVLLSAAIVGTLAVRRARDMLGNGVRTWLLALLAATVYFTGEEVSWGQHLLGWESPDWYIEATGNRQRETNLHNLSSWFNQKPRHLFQGWVVIGGIFVPLARRLTRRYPDPDQAWSYWFWPTWVCTPMAALAIVVRAPEWFVSALEMTPRDPMFWTMTPAPPSETQEYCMAAFLLVYFCSIHYRLATLRAAR